MLAPTNDVLVGSELAFAPSYQANVRARYEWPLDSGMMAHVMPQLTITDDSVSDVIEINKADVEGYAALTVTTGLTGDSWSVELFANNLTDERGEIANNFVFDRERVTVMRPRTIGIRVGVQYSPRQAAGLSPFRKASLMRDAFRVLLDRWGLLRGGRDRHPCPGAERSAKADV